MQHIHLLGRAPFRDLQLRVHGFIAEIDNEEKVFVAILPVAHREVTPPRGRQADGQGNHGIDRRFHGIGMSIGQGVLSPGDGITDAVDEILRHSIENGTGFAGSFDPVEQILRAFSIFIQGRKRPDPEDFRNRSGDGSCHARCR